MTKTETMKVLSILKATYPAHYKGMADADLHAMVDVWTDILGDADYMQVTMAVKEYIATDESGFPPAIGKLNHIMHSRFDGETLTPQEASAILAKAASRSGWNAEEEFNKLPPAIQRIVRSPEMLKQWAMMDADTFHSVVLSNFQRSYQKVAEQERKTKMLPKSMQNVIDFGEMLRLKEG